MSGVQRAINYVRNYPIATYIIGGFVLHSLRSYSVNYSYKKHFARYDIERKQELEQFLAEGNELKTE